MIIYKVTNKTNNKSYIGKTNFPLEDRKKAHLKPCEHKRNPNSIFYKALRKYGQDNFNWDIVCFCDSEKELNKKEKYYIKEFGDYNIASGGTGGDTLSHHPNLECICEKKRISMIGKNKGDNNAAKRKDVKNKISNTLIKYFSQEKILNNNPTAKIYKISKNSKIEIIKNLCLWCKKQGFNYQAAINAKRNNKTYRGYRIELYEGSYPCGYTSWH